MKVKMSEPELEVLLDVCKCFMLWAVQEWGQDDAKRLGAVQDLLTAAGFDAVATCAPVFGGILPRSRPCTGPEGEAATQWLRSMLEDMPRGKLEEEAAHIQRAVLSRLGSRSE